jgi:hypothetical protein
MNRDTCFVVLRGTTEEIAMNTANLQLEGLYTVLAELLATLRQRDILSASEVADLLRRAEQRAGEDAERRAGLSLAEFEGVLFPIRLLMEAARATEQNQQPGFSALAKRVGQMKPPRPTVTGDEALALAAESERERDA